MSMKVNVELGKLYYSFLISRDKDIPNSVARNS